MLYKKGTIVTFSDKKGWYKVRVLETNSRHGIIVETSYDERPVGYESQLFTYDYPDDRSEERKWSCKEDTIIKILKDIDAL